MAKVYVSSTVLDLKAERRAVMEWLRAARHQAVDSYLPDSETVRDSCLDDVDTCDLYVLILGHRYGSQLEEENPEKLSITHMEFRRAGISGIPRVALLRSSVPDTKLSDLEDPQRSPLVLAFRQEVQSKVRPAEFNDLRALIHGLSAGVQNELEKLRTPREDQRTDVWLAAHLQDVCHQFANHMTASAFKHGTAPEELYLDLILTQGQLGKPDQAGPENQSIEKQRYTLEDVLQEANAPLLLIGEGGSGKTTSLLYAAATAADRAKTDQAAPIPIFVNLARLTELNDVPDLLQIIADSVPLVRDWNELYDLAISKRRHILFLFDSFNEMPERLQSNALVVLKRFAEKQKDHVCLIGSRPVPHVEQLARPPTQFRVFEILRLTSDQVQGFLQDFGLGSLYERMPTELRDLAGNPFMLLAIARILAGKPERDFPRNQGKLYDSFVRGWVENEESKRTRSLRYSYDRVKEPLLAYLAKRMTSAGQTSLVWVDDIEQEVEAQLDEIHQRTKRRGGMPGDWTVDGFLDEILGDGLLKRTNGQLHFIHQSVQEYFTGVYFYHTSPDALVDFTPRLLWEFVPTYALAEVPNHRFVPAFLMLAGLLDDSTKIVEAVALNNQILAAAAISSASRVEGRLLARLERCWLNLLDHDDLRHRVVGCSCIVLAAVKNLVSIQRLVTFALSPDFYNSYVGIRALGRLSAPDAVVLALSERARDIPDGEGKETLRRIEEAIKEMQSAYVVGVLFDQWRASVPNSSARGRFEGLLAAVDTQLRNEELQRIRFGTSDLELAADAELALARAALSRPTIASELLKSFEQGRTRFGDRVAQTLVTMRHKENGEIAAGLSSSDPVVREAAATLAAERRMPVGDIVVESIVRFDHPGWTKDSRISALVSLYGANAAVSNLAERSREKCYCIAKLPAQLTAQLAVGELSKDVKAELKRLDVPGELSIREIETQAGTEIWALRSSTWSGSEPLFQLRASAGHLELYDCNLASRASRAMAAVMEEASLAELWREFERGDPAIEKMAVLTLADRGHPRLADRLMAQLGSSPSADFVITAVEALGTLQAPQAVSLVNDLLVISEGEHSDTHPVWGPCRQSSGWADMIHRTLVKLNADADMEIQEALDRALVSGDLVPKLAALKEILRWFTEQKLVPERRSTWEMPRRLRRLLDLALHDSTESIRAAAGAALAALKSDDVQRSLVDAFADRAVDVQVAAGEALVRVGSQELYERIATTMLQVAKAGQTQDLRRRAGRVLSAIPGGVDSFYRPIQEELGRGRSARALEVIEAVLETIPEDANLFWWRGHALKDLGRLEQAADSYQRASELASSAPVIPLALANTYLELEDFPRAMETARRGVEIEPDSADAQSILAWSSYKAGAIPESVEAASKAVSLDPAHSDAIWLVLLGHLYQANSGEARSAFQHAMRVRQLLSPGLDTSFAARFVKEIEEIEVDSAESRRLVDDIKEALRCNP
jgi:tetratricopeptide (TPR) repeat protein